jgi:hypothetical protein
MPHLLVGDLFSPFGGVFETASRPLVGGVCALGGLQLSSQADYAVVVVQG